MKHSIIRFTFVVSMAFLLPGCLIETEVPIKPDPKVDARLEGVWRITPKKPGEIRGDRDEDDVGVQGYIIIAPLKNPDGTMDPTSFKALAFDSFERDSPNGFPEMFVSTRKHKGHDFLLVRLADHEKEKVEEGKTSFKNWVLDYEFNRDGELFLRFWSCEDFEEMEKVHPMKFHHAEEAFAPITLLGDETQLLDYYSDPKVRALLSSMGKYQKLVPKETRDLKTK